MAEEKKTHWRQLVNLDYIGAYSLDGKDITVKITSVSQQKVKGLGGKEELCTVAQLEGQKPFIINRTNAKMISKLHNSPYIQDWIGKSIILYSTTTSVAGETVECLRVRPTLPEKKKKVELTPVSPKWADAIAYIGKGGTVEKLLESYTISEENQAKLQEDPK